MYIEGGYKTVTPIQVANCLAAHEEGAISYRAVRVYFAALSLVAIREAAERGSKRKGKEARKAPRYSIAELNAATGLKPQAIRSELKRLKTCALLVWSERAILVNSSPLPRSEELLDALSGRRSLHRPIPVPRRVLRFVASSGKASLGKTAIAYVVRGLSIERRGGTIRATGSVKASWIADVFGLSLRSVKSARKALIDCELITKDTGSFQRKLNRDGAFFRFNCDWVERKQFAPLRGKSRAIFAPPYKYRKTSYEFKNQKTQSMALKRAGVCKANEAQKPDLRNVRAEDLKTVPRVRELFAQGVKAGWAVGSEAEFLNWTAAAVRALRVPARDPVRVFIAIVKGKRWELITAAQENLARTAIARFRERYGGGNVPRFSGND